MHDFSTTQIVILVVLAAWELFWKALALWRAGQYKQPLWFAILVVVNSAGILPIAYLLTHPARKGKA